MYNTVVPITTPKRSGNRRSSKSADKPRNEFWDMPVREKEAFLAKATQEIVDEAHKSGYSTTHGDKTGVFFLHPDGKREYI
ncbi:hypothetical protein [Sporomusa sphaeroides]|uniref:hypothetical protein n=1 Tax=Sporomusa sphaeroides TaxID=47679 RepID=UPI002BF4868A|nr:hypothetical protein [Sporomusa sphaeroides]HML34186.1 hypothetical protein [Sporomusa sphaeroides]